jgi:hypothetical protein
VICHFQLLQSWTRLLQTVICEVDLDVDVYCSSKLDGSQSQSSSGVSFGDLLSGNRSIAQPKGSAFQFKGVTPPQQPSSLSFGSGPTTSNTQTAGTSSKPQNAVHSSSQSFDSDASSHFFSLRQPVAAATTTVPMSTTTPKAASATSSTKPVNAISATPSTTAAATQKAHVNHGALNNKLQQQQPPSKPAVKPPFAKNPSAASTRPTSTTSTSDDDDDGPDFVFGVDEIRDDSEYEEEFGESHSDDESGHPGKKHKDSALPKGQFNKFAGKGKSASSVPNSNRKSGVTSSKPIQQEQKQPPTELVEDDDGDDEEGYDM